MNDDGNLDAAVASQGVRRDGSISVLLGRDDGGLTGATVYPIALSPEALSVDDMNGDGLGDIVAIGPNTNMTGPNTDNGVAVLVSSRSGTSSLAPPFGTDLLPSSGDTGDIDGDGMSEVVMTASSTNGDGLVQVQVLGSSSDGSLRLTASGEVERQVQGSRVIDMNADGRGDAVTVANNGDKQGVVSVLRGTAAGGLEPAVATALGTSVGDFAIAPLDGDGIPDLIVGGPTNPFVVLLGRSDGAFTPHVTSDVRSATIALGDVNGDSRNDLVYAAETPGVLVVAPGLGDGTFASPTSFAVGGKLADIALGDVSGDGRVDVVVADDSANQVYVLLNTRG